MHLCAPIYYPTLQSLFRGSYFRRSELLLRECCASLNWTSQLFITFSAPARKLKCGTWTRGSAQSSNLILKFSPCIGLGIVFDGAITRYDTARSGHDDADRHSVIYRNSSHSL